RLLGGAREFVDAAAWRRAEKVLTAYAAGLRFARAARSRAPRLRRGSRGGHRDQRALLEEGEDLPRRLLGALALRLADDLGLLRRLIRVRDAGELLDLTRAGLRVEALHVALLADLDRGLDVGLDEAAVHHLAGLVADLAVGRDRGGDHRNAVSRQEVGH